MIVSRAEWERLERQRDQAVVEAAGLREANEILGDQVEWLQGQLAAKDASILELRREGFNPPAATPEQQQVKPDPLHEEVRRALDMVAKPGDPLRGELESQAREALALGSDPRKVAESVRRGDSWSPYH